MSSIFSCFIPPLGEDGGPPLLLKNASALVSAEGPPRARSRGSRAPWTTRTKTSATTCAPSKISTAARSATLVFLVVVLPSCYGLAFLCFFVVPSNVPPIHCGPLSAQDGDTSTDEYPELVTPDYLAAG
jgi:hypothetical protein